MNILFYLHQFPAIGGIETVTATLANAFAEYGHQVTIVSHRYTNDDCVSTRLNSGIDVLHMPGTENVSSRNTAFLQQTIREQKINVVIFQDSYARIEENLFVKDLTVPVVVCEHSAPFRVKTREPRLLSLREILGRLKFWLLRERLYRQEGARRRWLYARCTRYVLLSTRFFGEFRAVTRLADTRKLIAIPDPLAPCCVGVGEYEKRNEIVFVATLNQGKGCDLLLLAWERICHQFPDWRLTILGDGTERPKLEAFAREHGLSNVSFEGYQSNPVPYFQRAKIFAFPSRFEGWGLVLVEAMSQGCVPVAFDSYSSVHDIVTHGETGLVVPAFDIEAYAESLTLLLTDAARYEQMSRAARLVPQKFSVQNISAQWVEVLEQVSKKEETGSAIKQMECKA